MLILYVDADGCPVKDEVYRVARRHDLAVRVVSNATLRIPSSERIEMVLVGQDLDAADDWIAERIGPGDIAVTADLPLAARCLRKEARALSPKGRIFREESMGNALASRELGQHLREMGIETRGPAPMTKKDRSRFLSKLEETIQAVRREQGR